MEILEAYNRALDEAAEAHRALAASAKAQEDERTCSIELMQASMLGDMLKTFGRVQHLGKKPNAMQGLIASFTTEAEEQKALGDYDASDRAQIKADVIRFALTTLEGLEQDHA